jgi:NADH-quinone oxidoreductase subunit N
LAGFFGKFLLLKSVIAEAPAHPGYYCLAFTALAGVVISLYYYFGVVRAIYWSRAPTAPSPLSLSNPMRAALYACAFGMLFLGVYPAPVVDLASQAAAVLKLQAVSLAP